MIPNFEEHLEDTYARLTAETLATWAKNPRPGAPRGHPYAPDRFAISTGALLEPSGALHRLAHELHQAEQADLHLHVTPCLHFTFLGLSLGVAPSLAGTPAELKSALAAVRQLWRRHVAGLQLDIHKPRLVPLPATLLLAGIPTRQLHEARQTFAAALLQTAWAPYLEARYAAFRFPPVLWHTTLARAHADYATLAMREAFDRYRETRFADLHLGTPLLVKTNYDWSQHRILAA